MPPSANKTLLTPARTSYTWHGPAEEGSLSQQDGRPSGMVFLADASHVGGRQESEGHMAALSIMHFAGPGQFMPEGSLAPTSSP